MISVTPLCAIDASRVFVEISLRRAHLVLRMSLNRGFRASQWPAHQEDSVEDV